MSFRSICSAVMLASSFALITPAAAMAEPMKNIVLVHGAWVDGSGWKPIYDILTKKGFRVSMVQEPETSFQDDVAAATCSISFHPDLHLCSTSARGQAVTLPRSPQKVTPLLGAITLT